MSRLAWSELSRPLRITLITAGLSAAGSVVGALCAAVALLIVTAVAEVVHPTGTIARHGVELVPLTAVLGAIGGAVGAPLLAWGLLRHVPLGRAIAWTAVGTVVGGLAGWGAGAAIGTFTSAVLAAPAGALVGFVAAAARLRRRATGAAAARAEGRADA